MGLDGQRLAIEQARRLRCVGRDRANGHWVELAGYVDGAFQDLHRLVSRRCETVGERSVRIGLRRDLDRVVAVVNLDGGAQRLRHVAGCVRCRCCLDSQRLAVELACLGGVSDHPCRCRGGELAGDIACAAQHLHRFTHGHGEAVGVQRVRGIGRLGDVHGRIGRVVDGDRLAQRLCHVACGIHCGGGLDGQRLAVELARDGGIGR